MRPAIIGAAAAVVLWTVAFAIAWFFLALVGVSLAHDDAITGRFLYDKAGKNCCLAGGHGDCQVYPAEQVRETPRGYELADGEVIPYAKVSPSEDKYYYRCKHSWQEESSCFFAPPGGV